MITEVTIQNFKSIVDLTIPLSNINVFIGENGCGKSNILEAVGFAAQGMYSGEELTPSSLAQKGIRVARPSLMFSSFAEGDNASEIIFKIQSTNIVEPLQIKIYTTRHAFPSWQSLSTFGGTTNDKQAQSDFDYLGKDLRKYVIYTPQTTALRGLSNESLVDPLGINGENLDVLIANLDKTELAMLRSYAHFISWMDEFMIDSDDSLKLKGFKLGRGTSRLYFKDKFMQESNNIFSAENANEGVLHVLFYLSLMVSQYTPSFFAVDNIENGLNPKLCRDLIKKVAELAIIKNKQVLITTHNPAVLDGLNLNDDRQRLFVVKRNDEGYTKVERIRLKPDVNGQSLKLSEMWMRGYLGGLPTDF